MWAGTFRTGPHCVGTLHGVVGYAVTIYVKAVGDAVAVGVGAEDVSYAVTVGVHLDCFGHAVAVGVNGEGFFYAVAVEVHAEAIGNTVTVGVDLGVVEAVVGGSNRVDAGVAGVAGVVGFGAGVVAGVVGFRGFFAGGWCFVGRCGCAVANLF